MSQDDDAYASTPSPAAVRAQLERILRSPEFLNADRVKRMLAFLVNESLAERTDQLNEYGLAFEVFGESPAFDPDKNSIVRTSAKRLRSRMAAYYVGSGKSDTLIIDLSKGYTPRFGFRPKPLIIPDVDPAMRRIPWRWVAAGGLVVAGCFGWMFRPNVSPIESAVEDSRPRRLFARATSEGASPAKILNSQRFGQLVMTPDGKKLYALSVDDDRSITVLGADNLQVKSILRSPIPVRRAFMSSDRETLYLSSTEPQVVAVDTTDDHVRRVIPVGAPAFDVAGTRDGRKLFLAMGAAGLRRIDLRSGASRVLSPLAHPSHLELDHAGKQLFVVYESGGPGGRAGHDVVDVYDVQSERSLYQIGNLPMVGGHPLLSPKDDVVLLDARDACTSPAYDHAGCGVVPSHPFHLFGTADRHLVASVTVDGASVAGAPLPQGTRVLLLGTNLVVWDWARRMTVETIPFNGNGGNWAAISSSGNRTFVSPSDGDGGIVAFDAEREECLPPSRGLVNYYTADGTENDGHGSGVLKNHEVTFAPGRMGQAFRFDGRRSYLWAQGGAPYCPYCQHSWTEAFFVRFDGTPREMTVLETGLEPGVSGRRIAFSRDGHLVLESNLGKGAKVAISSAEGLTTGRWYHVAAVTDYGRRYFYLDGKLQGQHEIARPVDHSAAGPMFIGSSEGKHNFLSGFIDEFLIYNRALAPQEVAVLAAGCRSGSGTGSYSGSSPPTALK